MLANNIFVGSIITLVAVCELEPILPGTFHIARHRQSYHEVTEMYDAKYQ